DWVDGVDLERLLLEQGNPGLPPSTVLRDLAQVAEALTYLHAHDPGVVHGDVKPANIFMTRHNKAVLVDFGLAASGAERARLGTPGFVAPEVAAGERPTRASDIYSLAMTAYALLTGDMHPAGRALWPDSLGAEQARVFERAIRLGTSTDPMIRPSSAGEFLELLRGEWDAGVPTGVLTFVMTDIEGSTALWDEHPLTMPGVLARHDALVASVVESRRGRLLKSMGEGDSTVSVFTSATDAVPVAAEIVRVLSDEPWPPGINVSVRVGAHTGEADRREGDFFGPTVNLAARVRNEAEGGYVFLSATTARLVEGHLPDGFALIDLGPHTLRGFGARENIFALSAPFLRSPPNPAVCPYRGLLAYEPSDEELFFGRDQVVETIINRLSVGSFLGIVGASGSGKSSIVRAGVMAAATRGAIDGITSTSLITPTAGVELMDTAADDDAVLLVIDQFEELFTICDDETVRASFVERLLAARGKILVSIRADFYGHCAAYPDLADKLAESQILLGPMRRGELQQVIEAPARSAGLRLEGSLTELILSDAAGEPGSLPLLSHALLETWARRDGRTLTISGYREAGGVGGAIARTAEKAFESLADEEKERARRIFLRLTELGEGTEDSSRRARLSELRRHDAPDQDLRSILERLTRARLVTVDDETVSVAHEALIREWPRLRGWLNEDRDRLRLHRDLTRAAHSWEALDQDPGALYRGAQLSAVLDWADADLSTVERMFVEASRQEQDRELREARRQANRLRRRLAGVAVALIVAIVAASVAVVQRSNARSSAILAQSGRLAALSRGAAPTHPDLGLLLALEANRLDDSVDTESALLGALEHGMAIDAVIGGFESIPGSAAFSPEGTTLAVVNLEGARLFDVADHRPTGPPLRSKGSGWQDGSFSPDGRTLAVADEQGRVALWDVASRSETAELQSPDGAWLQRVTYSPDGRFIAAGGREISHITLWDPRSHKLVAPPVATRLRPEEQGTGPIEFSPDSRSIAAPGEPGRLEIFD
ncbi:MAG: protein kinase domain-containing protein, partial [Actinomycetota bacterium]